MPSDTGATSQPTLYHIGVVVKDIDKTAEFLSSILGIGPWDVEEYSPREDELMVGEPFKQKAAMAKLGPVELELLEQLEGGDVWLEFLKTSGEGVHHICFTVPNWEEMVSKLKEQGSRMVAGGIFHGKRWCYFDTEPGGIIVELDES